MRFAFTEDQLLFRDTVAEFFIKECPPEKVRWAWEDTVGRDEAVWSGLAEMGVIGLTVPETFGGMGMNEIDLLPILTEAGRSAYPGPLVETVAVAAPLLAEVAPAAVADVWLPRIAEGSAVVTVQLDGQPYVNDMHIAQLLIAQRDDRLFAIPADRVRTTAQVSVDGARRPFSVEWDEADAELLASGEAGLQAANRAFDRGAVATAAQLIGLSEQMIAMTVGYVVDRKQFGVPIASFQALRHRLADMKMQLELARSMSYYASLKLHTPEAERRQAVARARYQLGNAMRFVGQSAVQLHGGIGVTDEYIVSHYFKKLTHRLRVYRMRAAPSRGRTKSILSRSRWFKPWTTAPRLRVD